MLSALRPTRRREIGRVVDALCRAEAGDGYGQAIMRRVSEISGAGEVASAARADGAYLPLVIYLPRPDEPDEIGF